MTLFMPPIQRKKKIENKYNPDSYRVISEDAVSDHPKYRPLPYRASFEPPTPVPPQVNNNNACDRPAQPEWLEPPTPMKNTRVLPQILPDYRANKPQPKACAFLDKNVRFLNEPICNIYTKPVQHEERYWWPTRANPGELQVPPYTEDSNYRSDFHCRYGLRPNGSGRHTAHTGQEAALGAVPVNYLRERDGSQRFYKEAMSYEHQYNSREDPNYPIRGKRQGAFVWNRMDPVSQRKFIEYYEKLHEEVTRRKDEGDVKPSSPGEKSNNNVNGVFVARSANSNNNKSGNSSPKRRSSSQHSIKSVTVTPPQETADVPCEQSKVTGEQSKVALEQSKVAGEQSKVTVERSKVTDQQSKVTGEQSKVTVESCVNQAPEQREQEQVKQPAKEETPVVDRENASS